MVVQPEGTDGITLPKFLLPDGRSPRRPLVTYVPQRFSLTQICVRGFFTLTSTLLLLSYLLLPLLLLLLSSLLLRRTPLTFFKK